MSRSHSDIARAAYARLTAAMIRARGVGLNLAYVDAHGEWQTTVSQFQQGIVDESVLIAATRAAEQEILRRVGGLAS